MNAWPAPGWSMKEHRNITLSENEIGSAYTEALRSVSTSRALISDQTRQYMADALREFYELLDAQIESKRMGRRAGNSLFPRAKGPGICHPGS